MSLSPKFPQFISISNLIFPNKLISPKLFSSINIEIQPPSFQSDQSVNPSPNPNSSNWDSDAISTALKTPNTIEAVDGVEHDPLSSVLLVMFKRFKKSPKQAFPMYKWVENRAGYVHTPFVFNSMIEILAKSGEFKWALMELLNKIKKCDGSELFSDKSLGFLIREYSRLGMFNDAFRLYEFAKGLEIDVFDVLLDELCTYGHVQVACDFVDRRMYVDPDWAPPLNVYDVLLDGWFRVSNIEKVERIWLLMRRNNLVPGAASYGKLVAGYCGMGKIDEAVELLGEMRRNGVRPTRLVYDPLVAALAGVGRLKEALGMLERFMVLEAGPTLTTYDSLVEGFCLAGDLDGAGKILKMMSSRGTLPDMNTYNHFFRYFSEEGKIEEGLQLYRKVIENGYEPNEETFDALLSMLCKGNRMDLAVTIRGDMRGRKLVLNSKMSKVLIRQFCETRRFKEAVTELEESIHRGFIPSFADCQTLRIQLCNNRLHEMANKVSEMVETLSWANPYMSVASQNIRLRRKSVIRKARDMCHIMNYG